MDHALIERFLAKADTAGECWTWQGGRNRQGYGRFWYQGALRYAHRMSYLLFYEQDPQGLAVCHRCDNPPCVRPTHLFLGTRADNNADMKAKGRACRGDQHPHKKITAATAAEIRVRYAAGGISQRALGAEYGLDQSTVSDIVRGESWHPPVELPKTHRAALEKVTWPACGLTYEQAAPEPNRSNT